VLRAPTTVVLLPWTCPSPSRMARRRPGCILARFRSISAHSATLERDAKGPVMPGRKTDMAHAQMGPDSGRFMLRRSQ